MCRGCLLVKQPTANRFQLLKCHCISKRIIILHNKIFIDYFYLIKYHFPSKPNQDSNQTLQYCKKKPFSAWPVTKHLFCRILRDWGSQKAVLKIRMRECLWLTLIHSAAQVCRFFQPVALCRCPPSKITAQTTSGEVNDSGCWICKDAAGSLGFACPQVSLVTSSVRMFKT